LLSALFAVWAEGAPVVAPSAYGALCLDYSATMYNGQVYNKNGFTIAMTLNPWSKCQMDINSGIARFVFETGTQITMYPYNSLGQIVDFPTNVRNGEIVYWYGLNGRAKPRKFVFTNSIGYPVSLRVTIQTLPKMLDSAVIAHAKIGLLAVASFLLLL